MRTETLRLAEDRLPQSPGALVVNGVLFSPYGPGRYRGPAQERVSFISLAGDGFGQAEIPREVTLSGNRFVRRCESYFLPLDATSEDVELLFDHLASRYELITDTALNGLVSRRLLELAVQSRRPGKAGTLRIADFGCGAGRTSLELRSLVRSDSTYRQVDLFGFDLSEQMVDLSRQRGFSQAFRCSYAHISFESSFFDVVIAAFVMHYFNDRRPLREIARILRPGGLFLANLPSAERHELERYRSMLHEEPSLGRIEVSEMETNLEQPRGIPVFRCEKLEADEIQVEESKVDLPDEPLPV